MALFASPPVWSRLVQPLGAASSRATPRLAPRLQSGHFMPSVPFFPLVVKALTPHALFQRLGRMLVAKTSSTPLARQASVLQCKAGSMFPTSLTAPSLVVEWQQQLLQGAIWLIKRTFQPSIIRKKRKTGFLVRHRTVGGRRTLARRKAKGRYRLGGGI